MSMESRWPSPVIYLNKDGILSQNSTDRMYNNPRALYLKKTLKILNIWMCLLVSETCVPFVDTSHGLGGK